VDELRRWTIAGAGALALILLTAASAVAQTGVIRGIVTDQVTGEPVQGAQVTVVGTELGQLTDADGLYTISQVNPGVYTVRARFLGRADQSRTNVTIQAGATVEVNFQLRETALRLEEIVATGVVDPIEGVKIPFSVGRLTAEDMPVPTTHSALAAIQGKVAGVSIVRGSGQPGSGVSILLRTPTSIVRNNTPMFVVDGVVLRTGGAGTMDLESLDIENIEVVKGAAAAALYGSRASAGVISITTARGSQLGQGQTRLRVRSELGQSELPQGVPLSNRHHYALTPDGQSYVDEFGNPTQDQSVRVIAPDRFMDNPFPGQTFDNVNAFYRPGRFLTNHVSLGHNASATNFHLSFNNYREKGSIITNDGYERNNVRMNLDHRLGDQLNVSASAYHNRSFRDNLSGSPFWDLLMYPPDVNLNARDADGGYIQQPDPTVIRENPIWRQTTRDNHQWRARTLVSGQLDFRPLHWFRMDGNVSYDRSDITSQILVPKGVPFVTSGDDDDASEGRLDLSEQFRDVYNGAASAHFLQTFGDLNTRMTLRYLLELEKSTSFSADSREFWVVDVPRMNIGQDQRTSSSTLEIQAEGYFAQLGLDYAGKYIADVLVRRDGSSLFGPENRWNTYYRTSAAYRMAEEAWWPWPGFIQEFKPRFSLGTAGGRPNFSDQYETWSVSSSGAVSKGTLGNRFLGPEHTTEMELGLDMILLNRYQLELTYAKQVTEDQLIQIPQPAVSGYSNQWQNSGEITGTTYEATLQALLVQRPDLTWSTTLVADHSQSEITEWNRVCYLTGITHRCAGANRSEIWGDRFLTSPDELPEWHAGSRDHFAVNDEGYLVPVGAGGAWTDANWGSTVEVDGRTYEWGIPIRDQREDGSIIVQNIGNSFPDFSMGWINQVRWKGLQLHTHVHAEVGSQVYNRTKQRLYQHFRHSDMDQTGKPENEKKPIDYYQVLYNTNNTSSPFVEDAGFLKLREVALTYRLSPAALERLRFNRLGLEELRVGLVGRNLFTVTPYTGFDPEVGGVATRQDNFGWPQTRTFTASFEVTF
jgi:TonB-linked SusC/RagA family outer membrane protein